MPSREDIIKILAKPSGYAALRLGEKLHPIQANVLDALFESDRTRVSFRAANGVGKTTRTVAPAILYALEMRNAIVISTARVFKQVTKQLIPALKSHSHLYPDWQFNDASIKINGIDKYVGFTTNEDQRFQGWHGKKGQPLLIIIDEAAGISEEIYKAVARCDPDWLLVTGSPLGCDGVFYSIETDEKMYSLFKHFKLTKFDCLKPDYWIDMRSINEYINEWAIDPSFIKSSVYAEFSVDTSDGIISIFDIDRCIESLTPRKSGQRHVAIDFAAGGAENVIFYRNGNQVDLINVFTERDTMLAARMIVEELNKLKNTDGLKASEVTGDADGLGLPIIHRIKELGWSINEWHGNAAPLNENYKNKITEAWFEGCKKIKNMDIIFKNDNLLKKQIVSRKHERHSSGKAMLESKENMASRGIKSPDRADSFFMSLTEPCNGLLTSIQIPFDLPTPKRYAFF